MGSAKRRPIFECNADWPQFKEVRWPTAQESKDAGSIFECNADWPQSGRCALWNCIGIHRCEVLLVPPPPVDRHRWYRRHQNPAEEAVHYKSGSTRGAPPCKNRQRLGTQILDPLRLERGIQTMQSQNNMKRTWKGAPKASVPGMGSRAYGGALGAVPIPCAVLA